MKASINTPCPEDWDKMKIAHRGRHCENCQKNVVDFTGMDRKAILQYLLTNNNTKVCGRIYPSQLDFSHNDILVTIEAISKQNKNSNLPFYLLTMGALLMVGCSTSNTTSQTTTETTSHPKPNDKKAQACSKKKTEDSSIVIKLPPGGELPIIGDIAYIEEKHKEGEPYIHVDQMPEFKGGIDSLKSYINQTLEYPKWEQENNIQGTVYVQFVIDKEGKAKNLKILRTVKNAKNFDKEVIRVVENMPNWMPGKHEGENVDVLYTMPIRFSL